jgi:SAM-dependent methyltransferase
VTTRAAKREEWADPDPAIVESLITESQRIGWRSALDRLESQFPFFAHRMRNHGLGNWHLLALRSRNDSALDVGCGFGSLTLGLSAYYANATGIDALDTRIRYARLRAAQDRRNATFLVASGLDLPVQSGSMNLVTLNGVLEWAGLFAEGPPGSLQRGLLREIRRALDGEGTLAVAIENRYAMETLVGMRDTHTQMRFAPALPRGLGKVMSRFARGEPFRTYLYGPGGYARLGRSAGFPAVRLFDLISSYNDYDFIVDMRDAASYRLLWQRKAVRTFYPRAGKVRRTLSRLWSSMLGKVAYAYLLFMGSEVVTLLDEAHPVWRSPVGTHAPGPFRFAVNGSVIPSLAIVSHDGSVIRSVVEVGIGLDGPPDSFVCLPENIAQALGVRAALSAAGSFEGVDLRVHRMES